jgi:hypothetical protein
MGWLARRWLGQRWMAVVPVLLIVGVGATGTMVSLAAADRTSNAYADYLERSEVGDVVINPAAATQEIADVIRNLPGVERMTTSALMLVSFEEGKPGPRPGPEVTDAVDDKSAFTLASADGRYFDMDRPAVQSGRMPTGPNEAVVTPETAKALDIHTGDVVPVSFWQFGIADGLEGAALDEYLTEDVGPIGIEHVTITGVVKLADEVLPDELYPRQRVILSPDLAARYDCLPPEPPPGVTLAEAVALMVPDTCAFAQHYFSLEIAGGAAGVEPALNQYLRLSSERNAGLLDISDLGEVPGDPPQYYLIPTETALDLDRVDGAIRPTVVALVVLGLAAGALTIALAALAMWRDLQRTRRVQRQWHELGVSGSSWTAVIALPLAGAVVAGVLLAIPTAWLLDAGPVGLVAAMEPHAERRLEAVALLALLVIAVVLVVFAGAAAALSSRRVRGISGSRSALTGRRRPIVLRVGSPVITEGIRAAYFQRTSLPVVAGATLATAALVAALTFGGSLSNLVSTPSSYGWPWDVGVMTGAGYGGLDVEHAHEVLDADPDVADWTYLGFMSQVSLGGDAITAVFAPGTGSDPGFPVLAGALPVAADQVAIGANTARDLALDVGDTVGLDLFFGTFQVTVSGIVVFPTVGPFGSDRVSVGNGLLLPGALFDSAGMEQLHDLSMGWSAFVGVELSDGAPPGAGARIVDEFSRFDLNGVPPNTFARSVRPAEIIDAARTQALPNAIGIGLATVALIGLALVSWASVRSRRRELSVLSALGMAQRQIRHTVWVQSVATVAGAIVIGVPLGAVVGRALWRRFADELGVVPDPANPLVVMLLTAVIALFAALVAAQIPARIAARTSPAIGLRTE